MVDNYYEYGLNPLEILRFIESAKFSYKCFEMLVDMSLVKPNVKATVLNNVNAKTNH